MEKWGCKDSTIIVYIFHRQDSVGGSPFLFILSWKLVQLTKQDFVLKKCYNLIAIGETKMHAYAEQQPYVMRYGTYGNKAYKNQKENFIHLGKNIGINENR